MTERNLGLASLVFAAIAALLYLVGLRAEPPPPPPPAPTVASTPKPRRTPPRFKASLPKAHTTETELKLAPPDPNAPAPPPTMVTIRGRALLDGGSPADNATVLAYLGGRRKVFDVDSSGRFEFTQPAASIRLRAERKDGQLTTASEWVELDAEDGGEWEVDLVLPEEERGGLGIRIGKATDGIRVRAVLPRSPAAELGLERGDVIIELGGESVAGWDTSDFAALMAGSIGSEQVFTVRRADGTEEELAFVRRFLER